MSESWTRQSWWLSDWRYLLSHKTSSEQCMEFGDKSSTLLSPPTSTQSGTFKVRDFRTSCWRQLFWLRESIRAQYIEGSGPMRVLHSIVPPARYLDISDIRHALSVVTIQCLNDSFSSYLTFLVNIKWLLLNRITCYSNPKPSKSYKCYAVLATCL